MRHRTSPRIRYARVENHVGAARTDIGQWAAMLERLGERVTVQPDGCWQHDWKDYGRILVPSDGGKRRWVQAHRLVYETLVGPIPEDHHLHHECENKRCVNPEHLTPLTPGEHQQRHREMKQERKAS